MTITRHVRLTPEQAYAIAADVGAYEDYLPLVEKSAIISNAVRDGLIQSFKADLTVGYKKLGAHESFESDVVCDSEKRTVTATSSDGPIKALKAVWKVGEASSGGVDVSFTVDYALRSMMLQIMARGVIDFAASKIMQAFEERGRLLYGLVVS